MIVNLASTVLYIGTWDGRIIVYDILKNKQANVYKDMELDHAGEPTKYHMLELTNDDSKLMLSDYNKNFILYEVTNIY